MCLLADTNTYIHAYSSSLNIYVGFFLVDCSMCGSGTSGKHFLNLISINLRFYAFWTTDCRCDNTNYLVIDGQRGCKKCASYP